MFETEILEVDKLESLLAKVVMAEQNYTESSNILQYAKENLGDSLNNEDE